MRLRILAVLVAVLLLEGTARLSLLLLDARGVSYAPIADTLSASHGKILNRIITGTTRYIDFSAELGWTIHPGGEEPPLYRANAEGIRADHEYGEAPPAGVLRVEAFGDSFTHGADVPNSASWTGLLERPGEEVLNFGVGGYGLDQALLRYRLEGRHFRPAIVLIGYMSENLKRSVNVYRPFYNPTGVIPLAKPRFRLDHDTLVLLPNPMRTAGDYAALRSSPAATFHRLGADDYYYRTREHSGPWDALGVVRLAKLSARVVRQSNGPLRGNVYNTDSEAFKVTVATMAEFVREVRADGAMPVVLLFPQQLDLHHYLRDGTRSYDPLRKELDRLGLPYLDLVDAFEGCRPADLPSLIPSHLTAKGDARVAAYLANRLDAGGIRPPGRSVRAPRC
jgi:hypothetical protein